MISCFIWWKSRQNSHHFWSNVLLSHFGPGENVNVAENENINSSNTRRMIRCFFGNAEGIIDHEKSEVTEVRWLNFQSEFQGYRQSSISPISSFRFKVWNSNIFEALWLPWRHQQSWETQSTLAKWREWRDLSLELWNSSWWDLTKELLSF